MKKKHMAMEQQVCDLLKQARQLQSDLVTAMVRDILRDHKHLERFVMGMGDCYFLTRDGDKVDLHTFDYMADLERLIDEWELTGTPKMVYSDGTVLTDW